MLARRATRLHDAASLELSAKLLELNPEARHAQRSRARCPIRPVSARRRRRPPAPLSQVLTAWNLRRDALAALLPAADAPRAAELLGAPCSARGIAVKRVLP